MRATKVSAPKSRRRLNLSPNLAPLASDGNYAACLCGFEDSWKWFGVRHRVCFQISAEEKDLAVMQVLVLLVSDSDGYFISHQDRMCLFV